MSVYCVVCDFLLAPGEWDGPPCWWRVFLFFWCRSPIQPIHAFIVGPWCAIKRRRKGNKTMVKVQFKLLSARNLALATPWGTTQTHRHTAQSLSFILSLPLFPFHPSLSPSSLYTHIALLCRIYGAVCRVGGRRCEECDEHSPLCRQEDEKRQSFLPTNGHCTDPGSLQGQIAFGLLRRG
jgi:hypothetical protein